MAAVALDGVTVRSEDGAVLVDDVTLKIAPAERWAVLGANGAGKSTLAAVIAAQRLPSSGIATVLGHELGRTDLRTLRKRIGYSARLLLEGLRQDVTALEVVAAGRNAALETWWHDYTEDDWTKAAELLDAAGVPDPRRALNRLSEGERQRVMLARLLVADPELLVLDEPSAGLDFGGREALIRQLDQISRDSTDLPIVLVTHHLEEIPHTFTHALLVKNCDVIASGDVNSVLTDEHLSECFGLPVRAECRPGGRWQGWAE
jgi:iron complex transport system ATP-binding protein